MLGKRSPLHRDANPAALRMLGYPREELLRLCASPDILAAQEHHRLDREVALTLDGVSHHQEWVIRRKDGSAFIAEATAKALDSARYFTVFRDITEAPSASSGNYRRRLTGWNPCSRLPDLMFRVDREGVIHDFHSRPSNSYMFTRTASWAGKSWRYCRGGCRHPHGRAGRGRHQGDHRGAVYALPMPEGQTWYEVSITRITGSDPANPGRTDHAGA
jgi:PAS domain S-box-containing protein